MTIGAVAVGVEHLEPTLGHLAAVDALERALRGGPDVEGCPARASGPVPAGELLLMPAAAGGSPG
ncbi:hypothetical protein [Kitasatospora sp. NPDC090308]|uniref:hypothetical protein n=1 Tax=Kitasatospora sp. NPDC090308 TaxID=3364082 RepID=UPI0037F2187D